MPTLLHVDSSPRGDRSHSRRLSGEVAAAYAAAHPGTRVVHRDVGHTPPPFMTETTVAGFYTPPADRTPEMQHAVAVSDRLVGELLDADTLVLGVPMYNFGVPAALKAWIDQVVRIGKTFDFDPSLDNPYVPLVHGKQAFIASVSGGAGYGEGGDLASMNHQVPYLQQVLGFIGITDVSVVRVENAMAGDEVLAEEFARASGRTAELMGVA